MINEFVKKEPMPARGVRMKDETWDKVKKLAKENKVKTSDIIRHAIETYLEKNS